MSKEYRKHILEEASRIVCTDRNKQYGDPEDNFETIADLWSGYLSAKWPGIYLEPLSGSDVAIMMVLLKVARVATSEIVKMDSLIDIAGYAACAGGLVAGDLVPDNDEDYNVTGEVPNLSEQDISKESTIDICNNEKWASDPRVDYQDCSNAMLKMWMDNVVTDGEYNRIMDKLNVHLGEKNE